MKKFTLITLLLLSALSISSCNLSQVTRTLPAPKPAKPTIPPALTVTNSPVVTGSATPKAASAKTAPANPTLAKTNPPPAPSATQPKPTNPPAATSVPSDPTYPAEPDGVVQAFAMGYPDQTTEMLRYLSSSLKSALPSGGPAVLLKIQGDINGFAILSGSQTPNPSEAVVVAAMQAGGSKVQRTFNLIKENNRWVINSIN